MYRLMAGAQRYAIEHIEQAPVIVLAAARGNIGCRFANMDPLYK